MCNYSQEKNKTKEKQYKFSVIQLSRNMKDLGYKQNIVSITELCHIVQFIVCITT